MSENDQHNPPESPILAERTRLIEDDLRTYVGDEADYYLEMWRPLLKNGRGFVGFNWPATLFGAFWFLYRKMYGTGAAFLVLITVIGGIGGYQQSIPAWIMLGFLANLIYYRKAKRVVTKVRFDHPDDPVDSSMLAKIGGTNGTVIVVIVVILVIQAVIGFFLGVIGFFLGEVP